MKHAKHDYCSECSRRLPTDKMVHCPEPWLEDDEEYGETPLCMGCFKEAAQVFDQEDLIPIPATEELPF